MKTIYLIEETVYGSYYTDIEIIYACFDKEQAEAEMRRLKAVRIERKKFDHSYRLSDIEVTPLKGAK